MSVHQDMEKMRHRKSKTLTERTRGFRSEELLFQPWFLPQRVAFAIRSLAPINYHLKMRHMFDDYGCMICGKDHDYGSIGMCLPCFTKVRKRLERSVRIRQRPKSEQRFYQHLFRQGKLAAALLRNFSAGKRGASRRRHAGGILPMNPVDEALSPCAQRVLDSLVQ
jgi:hypothetical protein